MYIYIYTHMFIYRDIAQVPNKSTNTPEKKNVSIRNIQQYSNIFQVYVPNFFWQQIQTVNFEFTTGP